MSSDGGRCPKKLRARRRTPPPRRGGPPRRGWGRDWSQDGGWQDARERRASQDRERERKKRRAGDGR